MVDTIDQALNAVGDVVADIADVNILEGLTQQAEDLAQVAGNSDVAQNIVSEAAAGNVPAVGEVVGNLVENTLVDDIIGAAVGSEMVEAVSGEVFHSFKIKDFRDKNSLVTIR